MAEFSRLFTPWNRGWLHLKCQGLVHALQALFPCLPRWLTMAERNKGQLVLLVYFYQLNQPKLHCHHPILLHLIRKLPRTKRISGVSRARFYSNILIAAWMFLIFEGVFHQLIPSYLVVPYSKKYVSKMPLWAATDLCGEHFKQCHR